MKTKTFIYNLLLLTIIVSSGVGIISTYQSSGFMSGSILYYYTIQSNIIASLSALLFLFLSLLNIKISSFLYDIKYIITMGITITFLVFLFVLTPQIIISGKISYLLSLSNITLHFLTPICYIFSFIFFDKNKIRKNTFLLGTIMPLSYMIFIYINSFIHTQGLFTNFDGTISKYPYFFFDYEKNGWFTISENILEIGIFYWIFILTIVVLLISILIIYLNKKLSK